METMVVKLKQHTPLLHFQPGQEGATLRASEVKPRLDSYLKDLGFDVPKYKLHITPEQVSIRECKTHNENGRGFTNNAPSFFGDGKSLVSNTSCTLRFSVMSGQPSIIKNNLAQFFLTNNFGTRQTKGYGSFSVEGNDTPEDYISFYDVTGSLKQVLDSIETLHRTLRSGINGRAINGSKPLYFKSLMFSYAKKEGYTWDKKSIKETYLNNRTKKELPPTHWYTLEQQQEYYRDSDQLNWSGKQERFDFRDYLGFSTNESWMAYNNGVAKSDRFGRIKYDRNGNKRMQEMSLEKQFSDASRFKSPLLYKPIRLSDSHWRIYILINEVPSSLLAKSVSISSNMNNHTLVMPMYPKMDLRAFLRFCFIEEDIRSHFSNVMDMDPNLQQRKTRQMKAIMSLYEGLKKNYKK